MSNNTNTNTNNIYSESIISRRVRLPYTAVGEKNILMNNLTEMVSHLLEGKCSKEGYIQVGTLELLTYSVGLQVGNDVEFEVVIKCRVCNPMEGMVITCVVKNVTTAGLRAELTEELEIKNEGLERREKSRNGKDYVYNSPIVVYLASQHHYGGTPFEGYKEGDEIQVEVKGQRFELNDKHVNIIGKLVDSSKK